MEILCVGAHAMSIVTRSALEQNVVLVGHGVYNAGRLSRKGSGGTQCSRNELIPSDCLRGFRDSIALCLAGWPMLHRNTICAPQHFTYP